MAKKKSKKDAANPGLAAALCTIEDTNQNGNHGLMDPLLKHMVKEAQEYQALEGQVFSANDDLSRLIFLPVPALAARFLTQNDGWPLGRFFMVSGPQEACKSALTFEVGTWHRKQGGNHVSIECEHKDASSFRDSFFNYDHGAWFKTRCSDQDAWNKAFFWWMERYRALMDGGTFEYEHPVTKEKKKVVIAPEQAVGRKTPLNVSVDSISAVTLAKFVDKILEEGAPDQQYAVGAKMLAEFFRVGPKQMLDYPFSFMAVSHQKMSTDKRNPNIQIRNTTGGQAPKFQMTFEVEMKRRKEGQMRRTHKKYGDIYSIPLTMKIKKNSLGGHEDLNVEMCWYMDQEDIDPVHKQPRQKTYFDWHTASIELIRDCMKTGDSSKDGKGFSTRRAKELYELVDLTIEETRRTATSKVLGIQKLSLFEAGQVLEHRIQTDERFQLDLYNIMGIKKQFLFKRGVDFRDQIAENTARLEAAEEVTARSMVTSDMPLPVPPHINGDIAVPLEEAPVFDQE